MKTKKVLLASLILAGMAAACTNEEIVDVANNNATLAERTQVNLTLSASSVESRMGVDKNGNAGFTSNDVVGAVLVDGGYSITSVDLPNNIWNNIDWTIQDGHVGNNKWAYDGTKFTTEGTTAVGAWVFYTKYNSNMTTSRNGIEFSFPQIQDGAADFSKIYNNNINFMVSPVVYIDGYEGQNLNFDIAMNSVYSYLNMKFDFKALAAVEKVQKIVVKALDASDNVVPFAADYTINNKNIKEARLSIAARDKFSDIECPDDPELSDLEDMNAEMALASKAFYYNEYGATNNVPSALWTAFNGTQYSPVASQRGTKVWNELVVDFDGVHTDGVGDGGLAVTDGLFSAYMLIPAGVYAKLQFDIYTNAGVYQKKVENRYACADAMTADQKTAYGIPVDKGDNEIFLRPGRTAVLSDIENKLKGTDAFEYIQVKEADEMDGNIIAKTADLINFINGIVDNGLDNQYTVTVLSQEQIGNPGEGSADDAAIPAHAVVINKAVMAALEAKEAELDKDIQLIFQGAKMQIKGGTDAANTLALHDLTFNNGAELTEGYAKAIADVVIPTSQIIDVKGNSTLQLAMNNTLPKDLYQINVEEGSNLNVISENVIYKIVNNGNVKIGSSNNKIGSLVVGNFENRGEIRNFNELTVTASLYNYSDATLITAGKVTVEKAAINAGAIANSSNFDILGTMTNNGTISNTKSGFIFVTATGTDAGAFNNGVNGVITNNGRIYTNTGDNTIQNLGLINAMAGSTTYITTNSKMDEKSTGSNGASQVMGTIKIEKRNTDISVTEPNFQGYKEYTVVAEDLTDGVLSAVAKDKFNKIVLSTEAELSTEVAGYVNYIVTSSNITLPKGDRIQELEFTGDAEIYAEIPTTKVERVVIGQLKVNEDLFVKLPTENALYVYGISSFTTSKTDAKIINNGEILVGGDLYTELSKAQAKATSATDALFTAGHGASTAWHWEAAW